MAKTTTARGLGWQHQQTRQRHLASHRDGTPCWWCGQPMYRDPKRNWDYDPTSQARGNGALAADHTIARAHGGTKADRLLHGVCNSQRGDGTRDHLRPTARTTTITITSCGTDNRPRSTGILIDCRHLPNPHDVPGLRPRDGRSDMVRDWVLGHPETRQLIATELARIGRPAEPLSITVMCSAGQHRAVVVADELATRLASQGHQVTVTHTTLGLTRAPQAPAQATSSPGDLRLMPWPW